MDPAHRAGRNIGALTETPLYAEDLAVGDWVDLGTIAPSRADIVAFASQYDPLPIHLDGATSPFGDVIASGIHTMALYSGLAAPGLFGRLALVAGKGIERLRFPHPVRPATVLRAFIEITQVVLGSTRADVHCQSTMIDPADDVVLSFVGIVVVNRRNPDPVVRPSAS